jgi:hypothetical protein
VTVSITTTIIITTITPLGVKQTTRPMVLAYAEQQKTLFISGFSNRRLRN